MQDFYQGTCEWFGSGGQSYGFIKYDLGQIYVHYKKIKPVKLRDPNFKELRKGDVVKFRVIEGHRMENGTQAAEVEIIEYGRDTDRQ